MDWVERTAFAIVFCFSVLMIGIIIAAVYDDATSEHFMLRKDAWTCTQRRPETTIILVDKTPVPVTHFLCTQWTEKS